jgi:hypothetical protein
MASHSSEADWAYAKRALSRGDVPEEAMRRMPTIVRMTILTVQFSKVQQANKKPC